MRSFRLTAVVFVMTLALFPKPCSKLAAAESSVPTKQLTALDDLVAQGKNLDANRLADSLEKSYPDDLQLIMRRLRIYKSLKYWHEAEELGLRAIPAAEAAGNEGFLFELLDEYARILWLDEKEDLSNENIKKMTKYRDLHPASRMVAIAEKLQDDRLLLRAYARRALCHRIESGKFQYLVAVDYWKKFTAIAEQNGWADEVTTGNLFQAHFLSYAGRHEEALKLYDEIGAKPYRFTLVATDQWQRIHDDAAAGLAAQEKRLAAISSEDQKRRAIGWNERSDGDYLVAACIHLDRPVEAIEASEKINGWIVRDLLASKQKQLLARADESSIADRKALTDAIQSTERQLATAKQDKGTAEISLQRDLSVQSTVLAQFDERSQLARRDLEVAVSGTSLRLPQIQAMLDENTALLIYHVIWSGRLNGGFAAAITRDGYKFVHVPDLILPDPSPLGGIRAKVEAYRTLISSAASGANGEAQLAQIRRAGADFYNMLIAPIETAIKDKKHLVIIPGGPLARLPFHMLTDPEGRYLIERHNVSYAQSATVLQFCLARQRKVSSHILAVANPALNQPGYSLKFAEEEARAIQSQYPDCRVLTGAEATVANVLRAAPGAGILHFACHGMQDPADAMNSFLALAPDANGEGRLITRDIFDMDIRAGLVTLSACETGEGVFSPGQVEFVGMTRAWMFAGAPSVLVSLWKLDDRSTSELMAEFYKNLKTMSRAEALQRAQVEMMKKYENPYYWGAFVLYGDYR